MMIIRMMMMMMMSCDDNIPTGTSVCVFRFLFPLREIKAYFFLFPSHSRQTYLSYNVILIRQNSEEQWNIQPVITDRSH